MRWNSNDSKGFTLLEVLIAVVLMTLAFSSIFIIQSTSLDSSYKSKNISKIALLAKQKLAEAELEIEDKEFNEVTEESSGNFEAPYQDFAWKRIIREVKFPDLIPQQSEDSESENSEEATPKVDPMLEKVGKMVTQFLADSIREVEVQIIWKKSKGEQIFSFAMYWVHLNQDFVIQ